MLFETPVKTKRLLLRPETEADCDDYWPSESYCYDPIEGVVFMELKQV